MHFKISIENPFHSSTFILFTQDGEKALHSLHRQCLPFVLRRLKVLVGYVYFFELCLQLV